MATNESSARNKLIVALDVDTHEKALEAVKDLRGEVGGFKIGNQLFRAAGPELVREIVALDELVFLDLKDNDIPATVAAAVVESAKLGVEMINVHILGGRETMTAAVAALNQMDMGADRPLLLGVTLLTSLTYDDLVELGLAPRYQSTGMTEEEVTYNKATMMLELVVRFATLAKDCGLDGVICSPNETTAVQNVCGPDFVIVNPGIRPAGSAINDQKRIATPASAVGNGAHYIVVGRPVLKQKDRRAAARAIVAELETATN